METLKNHVIIYDSECPMCNLYTSAFVKTKMLDENGREAFTEMSAPQKALIDQQRACDEIALIDVKEKKVFYGIDSLFEVIGHSYPIFKPLFKQRIFRAIIKRIYAFVSYNRKVIIPGRTFEGNHSCTPAYNVKYRIAYIVFAWLVTSFVLASFAPLLAPLVPKTNFIREFLICGGQIIFQGLAILILRKERLVHYLGNMMTVSMTGALLLLPALVIGKAGIITTPLFFVAWFMTVVFIMLVMHMRRVKVLEINAAASLTWVIYRLLVLLIIF